MNEKLYHYTCLFYLPAIINEGIRGGEIPHNADQFPAYADRPKAVNLTTNPSRYDQDTIWSKGPMDKTTIRITVNVPPEHLTSFRQLREKFELREKWMKQFAPYLERKHWFYVLPEHGPIPPGQFDTIELWDGEAYIPLSAEELDTLCAEIEAEKERALNVIVESSGIDKGSISVEFKTGVSSSWLLDGRSK